MIDLKKLSTLIRDEIIGETGSQEPEPGCGFSERQTSELRNAGGGDVEDPGPESAVD